MMMLPLDLASLLRHAAREHGDTAVVSLGPNGQVSRGNWRGLERRARLWGQVWERLGLRPGSVVAFLGWHTHGLLEAVLGTAAGGMTALTLNPRQFPELLIYAVNRAEAQALVFDAQMAPLVEAMQLQLGSVGHYIQFGGPEALPDSGFGPTLMDADSLLGFDDPDWHWPEVDENRAALISFTAANSGWPRGVATSHRAAVLQAFSAALPDAYGLSRTDVLMPLLPVSHSGGWALCLCAALTGAQLVLVPPGLDASVLAATMREQGVTMAAGPPSLWLELLDHLDQAGDHPASLRRAAVGAAAFPPALLKRLRAWSGVEVVHTWGMSEVAPPALVARGELLRPDADGRLPQGRPVFGVELALVGDDGRPLPRDGIAEGQLLVRGPWVLERYLGEAESPLVQIPDVPGQWLPTGDIARIAPDSTVTLTDRRKDLIRCGGEWISAQLLERIALLHPGVAEAAVIAQADEAQGERPLLVVVARAGEPSPSAEELLALYEKRVSDWQAPSAALTFPELPKLSNGEVDKRELRGLVETLLD
ncbi:MAG: AMP-binding protein [Burkholderiales bacterium]|uniref:AMP-binding protein n=1 Tax=Inhella sp. TaxID=1921806 RepID=UPI001ACD3EDC|nr:AMP-binding protein [Burkholderiales bacterium]